MDGSGSADLRGVPGFVPLPDRVSISGAGCRGPRVTSGDVEAKYLARHEAEVANSWEGRAHEGEWPISTFPRSPRLQKGAIVGLDPFNPLASVIVFQYNPDTLTRTLRARAGGEGVDRTEVLRLTGPPEESISLEVEIDAAEQLEQARLPATSMGIHPTLASLEMLFYPKSGLVIANEVLAHIGIIEVIPPEAPLTLFIWGAKRVVPVRLTSFTITEEAFDPDLNPIRAKVALDLRVLSYQELGLLSQGGALFMGHQIAKEVMATIGGVGSITGGVPASATVSFQSGG